MSATPSTKNLEDIKVILATDCGSTTSKARLFKKITGEYRFVASGEAPTTVVAHTFIIGRDKALLNMPLIIGLYTSRGRRAIPMYLLKKVGDVFEKGEVITQRRYKKNFWDAEAVCRSPISGIVG
ncbi:MAG: hypothetical protein QG670_256 [Thermoproteota archaeon]|nr:hypothetical protein [Thermoproteota archaeon]